MKTDNFALGATGTVDVNIKEIEKTPIMDDLLAKVAGFTNMHGITPTFIVSDQEHYEAFMLEMKLFRSSFRQRPTNTQIKIRKCVIWGWDLEIIILPDYKGIDVLAKIEAQREDIKWEES